MTPSVELVIITLTANPSIDRTLMVERVERGRVIRAGAAQVDAGGNGVNVSRALVKNGYQTLAVLPSGGAEGAQLEEWFRPHPRRPTSPVGRTRWDCRSPARWSRCRRPRCELRRWLRHVTS